MQTPINPVNPATPAGSATSSGSGGGGSGTALPSGTGTVQSLPPSLATALQNGGTVTARVSARPNPGQLTLSVPGGQSVQVQTTLPLPPGTSLTVALQNPGPPALLTLQPLGQTAVHGQGQGTGGQAPAQGQAAAQGTPTAVGTAASQPAVVTSLTQGSVLTATVTVSGSGYGATATGGNPAQSGAAQSAVSGQTAQGQSPAANAGGQGTAGTPAQTYPAGTTMQLRLLSIAPQGHLLSGAGMPGTLTGTVTGHGPGGTATVQTSAGTLSINVPNPPGPGTQLLLSIVGDPRLPQAGSGVGSAAANRFNALQDAIALLRNGDPGAAQRLTQSLIPQPNAQLGIAAAFLIGAMRQGGMDKWLGSDGVRSMNAAGAARAGLLGALDAEYAGGQGQTRDAAGQEWRMTTLPFLNQGQLDEIRLYVRDHSEEDAGEGDDEMSKAKRFVVEADFSRLGPIQFDGLAREKQIDLMIRSQKPLEPEERDDIRGLFADTVSALGLGGQVEFRVVPKFDLLPALTSGHEPPGVVV